MKVPRILHVKKDCSIPWFEQIKKTVLIPGHSQEEVFYSIKPSDYVTILATTSEGKIIVVRQFRPAVEGFTYEFPSGHREVGETPEDAIIRELNEETKSTVKNLVLLGIIYPDTGRLENRQWAFYANDLVVNEFPAPDKNEGIEVSLVTPDELVQMIAKGEFNHALDLCVIALAISKRFLKL